MKFYEVGYDSPCGFIVTYRTVSYEMAHDYANSYTTDHKESCQIFHFEIIDNYVIINSIEIINPNS